MSQNVIKNNSISFNELTDGLADVGCLTSPSEIHGILCGQLSAGVRLSETQWLLNTSELLGATTIKDTCKNLLNLLHAVTLEQLESPDFSSVLLLPDDDEDIQIRVESLGIWCHAFLSGFAEVTTKLTANTEEILKDFSEIAQIQSSIDGSEDAEKNFLEVCEYVRAALMVIFIETNTTLKADSVIAPSSPLTRH